MLYKVVLFILSATTLFAGDYDQTPSGVWVEVVDDYEVFIWRQRDYQETFIANLVDQADIDAALQEMADQGYHLVDVEGGLNDEDEIRYHGVFHPGRVGQHVEIGLSLADFEARRLDLAEKNWRLVHMDGVDDGTQTLFFGIFEFTRIPRTVLYGLTPEDVVAQYLLRKYSHYLFEIVAYQTELGTRFAAVWEEGYQPHLVTYSLFWDQVDASAEAWPGYRIADIEGFYNGAGLSWVTLWEPSEENDYIIITPDRSAPSISWPQGTTFGPPTNVTIGINANGLQWTLIDYNIVRQQYMHFTGYDGGSAGGAKVIKDGAGGPGT